MANVIDNNLYYVCPKIKNKKNYIKYKNINKNININKIKINKKYIKYIKLIKLINCNSIN